MPRLTRATPSYRLHKASGQAVVTLCGCDYYLGTYGSVSSRQEYDRLLGEWLANQRQLSIEDVNGLTVVELSAAYNRHAEAYYRKDGKLTGTILRVRVALRVLNAGYGRTAVTKFGPLSLQAIRRRLVQEGKSRRYVNYLIEEIKRVFKWGVAQELVPPSIYQALAAVAGLRKGRSEAYEPEPVVPIADAVVEATLPFMPRVIQDMVRFQRLTGCRPGEVCLLRPIDIDQDSDVWRYTPTRHKTEHHGRARVILIGPRAQAVLHPYLQKSDEEHCFSPVRSEARRRAERHARRSIPITSGNRPGTNRRQTPKRAAGALYTTGTYARAVRRACELAFKMPEELRRVSKQLPAEQRAARLVEGSAWRKLHCWSPNQLRHQSATEIRRRFGAEAAQTVLGHSHLKVTEIYAERDQAKAAEVMRSIG